MAVCSSEGSSGFLRGEVTCLCRFLLTHPRVLHRPARLLSMIPFQLSLQESSLLLVGGRARCRLWQQVNRMCSQLGVFSKPGAGKAVWER